ncbi:MAG: DUF3086 domain-containing protein [Promethearchaeota archaeon]
MVKCKRCGATLSNKATFCTVCGTPVSGARPVTQSRLPATPSSIKCSNCNKILKPGQQFCTSCGAPVTQATPAPVTVAPSPMDACPHCGFSRNPPDSRYCINCGQSMVSSTTSAPPDEVSIDETPLPDTVTTLSCSACGREAKANSKFCIFCGGSLVAPSISTEKASISTPEPKPTPVDVVEPIPVPSDVLASLMARGRQLAIEEEYAANGAESDALLDELSQAAADSEFELEELIDTYINERAELERLESLHEKGEVTERVYDRLREEYNEKLNGFDEKIQTGVQQLQGYLAQILQDYAQIQDELETTKARELIGDDESPLENQKSKMEDKANRYNYAITAARHILKKESTMRNGPISRFEVTETTLSDAKIKTTPSKLEKPSEPKGKETSKPEETDTASSPQPDAEAGKICNICGRITASDAKFCVHCGSPL